MTDVTKDESQEAGLSAAEEQLLRELADLGVRPGPSWWGRGRMVFPAGRRPVRRSGDLVVRVGIV